MRPFLATVEQYEFFRTLYDEEQARYGHLEARAKLYITIITIYLGALAFKISDFLSFAKEFKVPVWLFLLAAAVLVVALALSILAIRIRDYEGITDPEQVIHSFGEKPPKNEDFFDDRIADFAVAANRNSTQNNTVAVNLFWSSWALFIGVLIHFVSLVIALYKMGG